MSRYSKSRILSLPLIILLTAFLIIAAGTANHAAAEDNKCGDNATWSFSEGVLTISGTGDLYDYESAAEAPWQKNKVTRIVIEKGITSVGANSFTSFAIKSNLKSVEMADSVESIGDKAFYFCSKLSAVKMPANLRSIGSSAFYACEKINEISLPEGLTTIRESAFHGCDAVTELTIPSTVDSMGEEAFSYCDGITVLMISDGVTEIPEKAFYSCSKLAGIYFPSSLTRIGSNAFKYCSVSQIIYDGNIIQVYNIDIASNTWNVLEKAKWNLTEVLDISTANIFIDSRRLDYTGEAVCPEPELSINGFTLVKDRDYTLEYKDNVGPGAATLTATGIGGLEGTISLEFEICFPLENCEATLESTSVVYNGSAIEMPVTVTYKGKTLEAGRDFTVRYEDNVNAGIGYAIITGCGAFEGEITKSFNIRKAAAYPLTVSKTYYTLKANATSTRKIDLGVSTTAGLIEFQSSNSKFKVSSSGKVTVPKNYAGTAYITVNAYDRNHETSTVKVTIKVSKVPATKIRLDKKAKVGVKTKLELDPETVYSCEKLEGLKWKSSNKKVAAVNSKGVVTAKKVGKATITCTLKNKKKYKCVVTVKKNAFYYESYSDCDLTDTRYGDVKTGFLNANYSGKKLIVNMAAYNNRMFYAEKFDWVKLKVEVDGKTVRTYKFKNVPIRLKGYGKKKITFKIPMSKVYDLVNMGKDDFYVYVDDYVYTFRY